jgi:hypothetical protein
MFSKVEVYLNFSAACILTFAQGFCSVEGLLYRTILIKRTFCFAVLDFQPRSVYTSTGRLPIVVGVVKFKTLYVIPADE